MYHVAGRGIPAASADHIAKCKSSNSADYVKSAQQKGLYLQAIETVKCMRFTALFSNVCCRRICMCAKWAANLLGRTSIRN